MKRLYLPRLLILGSMAALAACGGGGSEPGGQADGLGGGHEVHATGVTTASSVSDSQRIAAVTATAISATNDCSRIRPFYWEMGRGEGRLASGSVAGADGSQRYSSTTVMAIASASKWIYGAYVTQIRKGVLSELDLKFLEMRAGYVSFDTCTADQTVDACLNYRQNGVYTAQAEGVFDYDGGHMEKHASLIGLGAMNAKALATEVRAKIGTDVKLTYAQPQLAGGVLTSADAYGKFLRKLLVMKLDLGRQLGTAAVCTDPGQCGPVGSQGGTVTQGQSWHYSIGHWVEDDPVSGDGAFSSGGSYGFYPWIDATRTTYGVIARVDEPGSGRESGKCGRLMREAWVTATAQ